MFKPVNPENIPWVLTYQGAMSQSADQGRTWTTVHSFDRDKQHAEAREAIRAQARSATGVVCGTETLDGVVHDTFDARMTMEGGGAGRDAQPLLDQPRQRYLDAGGLDLPVQRCRNDHDTALAAARGNDAAGSVTGP